MIQREYVSFTFNEYDSILPTSVTPETVVKLHRLACLGAYSFRYETYLYRRIRWPDRAIHLEARSNTGFLLLRPTLYICETCRHDPLANDANSIANTIAEPA